MNSKFFPTGTATDLRLSAPASIYLDFIRGVAAILVMISHLRSLFFVDYPQITHPNVFIKLFYFVTSLGHQAVVVFFVLSGFFITSSIIKMYARRDWSWKAYLIQRLSRLWVVLIPALLLTAFWDNLGIHVFHFEKLYSGLPSDQFILASPVMKRLGPVTFLGNVFFLQGIAVKTFGSNGPLWSLSYEFWYYIAFPCALIAATSKMWRTRLCYLLALLVLGCLAGREISLSFGIWLLGFAVLFLPHIWTNHKPTKAAWMVFASIPFALALALSVVKKTIDFSYFIAIFFTLLLYLILRLVETDDMGQKSARFRNFSRWNAGFSYSLYLLHLPPLIFFHAYLYSIIPSKWQPTPLNILYSIGIGIGVILYAWTISLVTEKKTAAFKLRLQRAVSIFSRQPVPALPQSN